MSTRTQVAISLTEFSLWSTCRIKKAIAIVIQEWNSSTVTQQTTKFQPITLTVTKHHQTKIP